MRDRVSLEVSLHTLRALLDYQAGRAAMAHAFRTAKRKAERIIPPEESPAGAPTA